MLNPFSLKHTICFIPYLTQGKDSLVKSHGCEICMFQQQSGQCKKEKQSSLLPTLIMYKYNTLSNLSLADTWT